MILTKHDQTTPQSHNSALQSTFNHIVERHGIRPCLPYVHSVSSTSGYGIDDLKSSMTEIALEKWADPTTKVSHEEVQKLIKQHKIQQGEISGDTGGEGSSTGWKLKVDVATIADETTNISNKRVFPGAGVLSPSVDPIDFIR